VHAWIDELIDGPLATELTSLLAQLDRHARSDSLGQKLIQLTAPGVPDVYQGTELWDDSLVDPDNRRPVDYRIRRAALDAASDPKIRVVHAALRLRREKSATFVDGRYRPLLAQGSASAHVAAFLRGSDAITAATRHSVRLTETGWGDTLLPLPAGTWQDRLGGGRFSGQVSPADLFTELPVALLERVDD
jgi:(1->4)-alpha-D-glucan 1-alpha-D-glucosylmutase